MAALNRRRLRKSARLFGYTALDHNDVTVLHQYMPRVENICLRHRANLSFVRCSPPNSAGSLHGRSGRPFSWPFLSSQALEIASRASQPAQAGLKAGGSTESAEVFVSGLA
jgi:hypothetical protein